MKCKVTPPPHPWVTGYFKNTLEKLLHNFQILAMIDFYLGNLKVGQVFVPSPVRCLM